MSYCLINYFYFMQNVFDFLKPKASIDRNGFDLSQRHLFSLKAGQRVPVMCIDCIPSDYHEIDVLSLTRFAQINTDSFTRAKVRFEFGFVPYWQMWHDWNDFILQTQESFSSSQDINYLASVAPNISLGRIFGELLDNMTRIAADPSDQEFDMFGFSCTQNALRLLDMLGYGSFYWAWKAIVEDKTSSALDFDTYKQSLDSIKVNPFRILAYQKFCLDYGRSTQYQQLNPEDFNVDAAWAMQDDDELLRQVMNALYNIRYSMWKKDMFTSLYPSPQFGAVSSVDLGTFEILAKNASSSNAQLFIAGTSAPANEKNKMFNTSAPSVANTQFTSTASIDVYQLKKAELFQKWKEDKLRAGNKLKDQAVAMWGKPFKYSLDNYAEYVGEVVYDLTIDEVVNQASDLGEIGGKGIGTGNGKITFNCDDFGVLLCVATVTPSSEYDSVQLDKNNVLCEPFDFATPAFENLGLEPVSLYQLSISPDLGYATFAPRTWQKTLGFTTRYLNYKTAVDRCHGEFQGAMYANTDLQSETGAIGGSLSIWSAPRTDLELFGEDQQSYPLEFLYINPRVMNPVFTQAADDFQTSDQFLFNTNFVVKSVRNLSISGLVRW